MSEENTAPAAPRKKSQETILKQDMGRITRELDALDKKLEAFEKLQEEITDMGAQREALQNELQSVKTDLIAELGLG